MNRSLTALLGALCLVVSGCSGTADSDEDLLTDAFELAIGTNPEAEDSDGDGFSDTAEWLAYFDPNDADDHPWEGAYPRGPVPAEIDGEGWVEGDLSNNWTAEDILGDDIDLYDFYGQVILVDVGAEWCGPCVNAAAVAQQEYEDWKDEGFVVANFVNDGVTQGSEPDGDRWANDRDDGVSLTFPVFEDGDREISEYYATTGYIPAFSVIDRQMNIMGVDIDNYEELVLEALEEEPPYVEWPLPENTVELRDQLSIEISANYDIHVGTNIALGTERAASGATASGGASDSSSAAADDTGSSSGYTTAAADGSYAGAPFGGASCTQAGSSRANAWLVALLLLGLAPLRRRS